MSEIDRPLVVVPADDPLQIAESPQLERLRNVADLRVFRSSVSSPEEQVERVQHAEVMINSRGAVKWPGPLLAQLPKLRMISTCSIGTDSIDIQAAARLNIVVSNIPGKTAPVVAEHALALILAAAKRLAFQTTEVKAGRWTAMQNLLLRGKTLGIIGTGAIGAEVIRLGHAIGMKVVAWTFNPSDERAQRLGVPFVSLEQLLCISDVISVHVKLTEQSRHMIGSRELEMDVNRYLGEITFEE